MGKRYRLCDSCRDSKPEEEYPSPKEFNHPQRVCSDCWEERNWEGYSSDEEEAQNFFPQNFRSTQNNVWDDLNQQVLFQSRGVPNFHDNYAARTDDLVVVAWGWCEICRHNRAKTSTFALHGVRQFRLRDIGQFTGCKLACGHDSNDRIHGAHALIHRPGRIHLNTGGAMCMTCHHLHQFVPKDVVGGERLEMKFECCTAPDVNVDWAGVEFTPCANQMQIVRADLCSHCRKTLGKKDVMGCPCGKLYHGRCALEFAARSERMQWCPSCKLTRAEQEQMIQGGANRHLVVHGKKRQLDKLERENQAVLDQLGVSIAHKRPQSSFKNHNPPQKDLSFIACRDHQAASAVKSTLQNQGIGSQWNKNPLRAEVHSERIRNVNQLKAQARHLQLGY